MLIKGNAVDWQTRFRLWAALTMACYAICYNIYYSTGIISLEALELFHDILAKFWPLFWLIPFAVLIHVSLGLWKLYKRNTLKLPLWEICQITLGISIPFFLLPHIIYTYGMFLFFGIKINYIIQLLSTYPHFLWQYAAMTLAVWIHAQIGVHGVLRMRSWYPKVKLIIIAVFSLMPVLGIAGYLIAGSTTLHLISIADFLKQENLVIIGPTSGQYNLMKLLSYTVYFIFPVLYIFVLTARAVRITIKNKFKNISVIYTEEKSVNVFPRTTILEASRIGNIPHASICGGRGRCTTCRVKIEDGMKNLSPVGDRESKALNRISATEDVRLACQAECNRDKISVTLLLPPDVKSIRARKENQYTVGTEMNLLVMFTDLRGFTRLSEEKFPYDVVFILNRYFSYMGEVIEKNGGKIDKFLGDGILAFFGFKTDHKEACRNAITAAKQMAERLIEINEQLKNALKEPLKIGIAVHYGEVILGELGYKDKMSLTIIGDTVNTTSRLEALNKKLGSQMIISSKAADAAQLDFSNLNKRNVEIRGKTELLEIFVIKDIIKELSGNTGA